MLASQGTSYCRDANRDASIASLQERLMIETRAVAHHAASDEKIVPINNRSVSLHLNVLIISCFL
ncbi:MAG TPA: hypothetical protein EYP59_06205 [Thiotrichaceae bacterium]|nr:hypothetical protein [Thiotrichaceae bacterium]